jgi:hypothetical protein
MKPRFVFMIDARAVADGVSEKFLGCPFILTSNGYPSQVNQHLRDIWLGKWPEYDEQLRSSPRMRYRAMPPSVRETANKLSNLLQWCAASSMHFGRERNELELTEDDIDRYATQMESGIWSSDNVT